MTTTLFQRMTETEAARQADAGKRFWQMAREAAAGADLDPAKVLEELKAIGKTRAEFEGLVGNLVRRRQLADQLATLPALEQQEREVTARLDELTEAFKLARQEYGEESGPLRHKLKSLKERITSVAAIRRELVDTCRDPGAVARVERARGAVTAAVAHLDAARAKVNKQRDVADAWDYRAGATTSTALEAEYRAEEARERRAFHLCRAEVTAAEAALKEAEAALALAEEQMYVA